MKCRFKNSKRKDHDPFGKNYKSAESVALETLYDEEREREWNSHPKLYEIVSKCRTLEYAYIQVDRRGLGHYTVSMVKQAFIQTR